MRNAYDKWLAGEGCCNSHYVHIEKPDCGKQDVCDCENILLQISNLHTDDLVLQEQIDEISGDVENKLDISAYTPVDLSDYYTKEQVDELIPELPSLSGYATEQWVQEQGYLTEHQPLKTINGQVISGTGNIEIVCSGGSGVTIDAYTKAESDARYQPKGNYATEQWVLDKHYITGVDLSNYATEQWVSTNYQPKGNYLTEHQPLKTINGQVISGTGNIEITASGGSINVDYVLDSGSTNPVVNSAITVAINSKLDASAYTPTEQVQSDWNVSDSASTAYIKNKPTIPSLAGYATEQWVLDKHYISGVDLSDYALKSEIPTVPTSNSAFTNDEHFITSGDSVFNNYALTANTYTKTEVNNLISNKIWCGTQAEYDLLSPKQNDVLYLIHE